MYQKNIFCLVLSLSLSCGAFSEAHATIIDTQLATGLEIRYQPVGSSNPDSTTWTSDGWLIGGPVPGSFIESNMTGGVTGAMLSSNFYLSDPAIGEESASVDFDFSMDGNDYIGEAYMGGIYPGSGSSNYANLTYQAITDMIMDVSWDFEYSGPEPFGLNSIRVDLLGEGNLLSLGNAGYVSTHTGNDSFNLLGGNTYTISTRLYPNATGGIGALEGQLSGQFVFNFTPATSPVPEPTTMLLLGTGLVGVAGAARRRKKNQA